MASITEHAEGAQMSLQPVDTERMAQDSRSGGNRLYGWRLVAARAAWVLITASMLAIFLFSLPYEYNLQAGEFAKSAGAAQQLGLSIDFFTAYYLGFEIVTAIGFVAVALIIFARRSDDWIALLVSLFLVIYGVYNAPAIAAPTLPGNNLPGWVTVLAVVSAIGAALEVLLFLFPDGRWVPAWTRYPAAIWLAWCALRPIVPALDPFFWPEVPLLLYNIGWYGLGIYAQVYRYRRVSTPAQRQQTKWIVFGISIAVAGSIINVLVRYILFPELGEPGMPRLLYILFLVPIITVFARLMIPITLGISVLRYRLWDIDPIINRTLVYGALTLIVAGIYVIVVSLAGALFDSTANIAITLPATALVAVLFQPLRERLQLAVNRLMYGERDDPYGVIARLGRRLEATIAPDAVLPGIVQTVAQALKLPYVAIELPARDQGPGARDQDDETDNPTNPQSLIPNPSPTASYGKPRDLTLRLPLIHQNEVVGEMLLAERAPGEGFSPADRRLLNDLAGSVGVAVHNVRLTTDLQHSREKLVTAREEERRRLRRDLHDGLGPQLAGLTLRLDAIRNVLARDPQAADAMLSDAKGQTQTAIADIRRLVYNLRPPALDDLGLVESIREHAAQAGQNGLRIGVEAPATLPPLPAAVEVAAYRIAQEGITNVIRHAQAHSCTVRFQVTPNALELEITDDGKGISPENRAGVGLTSMRERATELGGTCAIEPIPTGGTRVTARLPVAG